MKICIIGHTERNYLPYMEKYTRFFDENGVDYDVVCWQREAKPRLLPEGDLTYYEAAKESFTDKLGAYLRFRKHVLSVLNRGGYDKVIVLTTIPALLLKGYLKKHYHGSYIFDYRDYSHEKFPPYRALVSSLIKNSALTTISSHGFMEFFAPAKNIVMNHNIVSWKPSLSAADLRKKQVINIGFIGGIRYFDENTFLIDKLKNTFRYQLWYIGQVHDDCDLKGYCEQHGVTNVSFVGKYDNSQKPELYRSIDIINSVYGSDTLEVTTALPNRLYEACLFKKPIITSKGTYLGEIVEQYGLGLVVDAEFDDVHALLDYYVEHFDPQVFEEGCERFLTIVKRDEEKLYAALREFISK